MKSKLLLLGISFFFALLSPVFAAQTQAQQPPPQLTGDAATACQAIICLSTGQPPNECSAALARYFSIQFRRFSDTLRGRINFLDLCPTSSAEGIPQLINDIANGAGNCDPDTLNTRLLTGDASNGEPTYISNTLPGECASYASNPLVRLNLVYVGDPNNGGRWAYGN